MKTKQVLNWIGFIAVIVVNTLASTVTINGVTTGEVSDSFPTLFTPAGYVFSIWGVIYLGLLAFCIFQSLPAQRESGLLDKIGPWFVLSCAFNVIWLFLWQFSMFLSSVAIMIGLLISLLAIYLQLDIGRAQFSRAEKWCVTIHFGIYLGWISVAAIANVSVALYDIGWQGQPLGPEPWTVLMLLVAGALGVLMTIRRNEVAYPLVIIWAAIGIAVKQSNTWSVAAVAALVAAVVLVVLALVRVRARRKAG
ncbi:MAG: tryptophan-rich sensory protein [Anaerolineae bacterium]|nr:tryptophan-rich sensory protein [Anaerolineae bacterium]